MKWVKILDNSMTNESIYKLNEIFDCLSKEVGRLKSNNIGLLSGKSGIALFFYYYSKLFKKNKSSLLGFDTLCDVFEKINQGFSSHTFCNGLSGIAWTIDHLIQNNFLETKTKEIVRELNPYLNNIMIKDIQKGNYDFLHGALGTGLYLLSTKSYRKSMKYLIQLIYELKKQSIVDQNGGIKWETFLDLENGKKGINLSLSHGISSIVVFLSKILEKGIKTEIIKYLITEAVQYLLNQQLDNSKHNSIFPSWKNESRNDKQSTYSRLAWCYGDLGIGFALWQIAQIIKNEDWKNISLEVLLQSTKRKDLNKNSVADACFCHGTAGIAHIYNRIFQHTGILTFKESAIYWIDETLKMAKFNDGLAGYKTWSPKKYGGWQNEVGLLEGITGIGFALMAAISDFEPKWDQCLLLS